MTAVKATRGRPLVALVAILGGWITARALLWDDAFVSAAYSSNPSMAGLEQGAPPNDGADARSTPRVRLAGQQPAPGDGAAGAQSARESGWHMPVALPIQGQPAADLTQEHPRHARPVDRFSPFAPFPEMAPPQAAPDKEAGSASVEAEPRPVPVRIAAGHQLLWMAALAKMPFPMDALARQVERSPPAPFYPAGREPVSQRRWSADGWLLLRRGGNASLATGAAPATYGASQMGAVLRYRLAPDSGHKPAAYMRATSALNGTNEREAAIGVSARPIPSFPVTAAVELRASDRQDGTRLRPAALAVTELPPFALPLGARGEFYAQAGYVGGRFKTAFADGQLRVDKRITRLGNFELRAGAGSWAGAQKGASRVDAGPTAIVGMPLSDSASARLGLDWRFRVAGNASPSSGPAMTLSAGF